MSINFPELFITKEKKIHWLYFFIVFILSLSSFKAIALSKNNNTMSKTQELNRVNQEINVLRLSIFEANQKRVQTEKELAVIESRIGMIANKISVIDNQVKDQLVVLDNLKSQRQELEISLNEQQLVLAKQVRSAYMLGQHQYLKLILNQQSPSTISRFLTYYKSIHLARIKIINDLKHTLTKLQNLQDNITAQIERLQKLETAKSMERATQIKNVEERERVVVDLKYLINAKSLRLATLVDNKRAIENILQKLNQAPDVNIPQPKVAFERMRGHLIWPARGTVAQHFGEHIDESTLINNAIFIRANTGDAVTAVYPGKIVFADWLRGLGLLIIIDHGRGYLTLYGHNHSLLKRNGDVVKTGEMIAKVGNSGGYEKSGLYFQIRADGKPLNPETWLKQ